MGAKTKVFNFNKMSTLASFQVTLTSLSGGFVLQIGCVVVRQLFFFVGRRSLGCGRLLLRTSWRFRRKRVFGILVDPEEFALLA